MTQEEKKLKIIELSKQILELKKLGPTVATAYTVQKLQQEIDNISSL